MKKLIKIVLGIVLVVILLLAIAVALFAVFFDANSFRGQIATQVKTATGRDLTIGDIHLSIFPTLGARIKNVSLNNAVGFGDAPFASVGQAEVGVRLLPLLRERAVQVSSVTVDGLQLNLSKHADGKTNWDDLIEKTSQQPKTAAPAAGGSSSNSIKSIDIAGISVSNAALNYRDDQSKQSYALSKLKLDTGAIEPGKAFDFDLAFTTQLTQPAITAETEISAKVVFDLSAKAYQASKLKVKLKASGKEIPNGTQTAEFGADLSYDGGKGTLSLANGRLDAGGLSATASLQGSGLNGSGGRFAGPLSIKPFNPRELLKTFGMSIDTADAEALKSASLSAQIEGSATAARLSNIVLELDQTHLSGNLGVSSFDTQALDFALKADTLDADRYLPPAQKQAATPAASKAAGGPAAASGSSDNTVLPIDSLEKLNANGTLDVGKFKLQNLSMTDVHLKIAAPRGREKRVDLAGKLYGGTLDNSTRITPGAKPVIAETLKLASINAGPLLIDLNGKDTLTGTGDVALNLSGAGRTVGELKRALDGNVSFNFKNGAVKGFNLGQIIRKGEAFMNGQQYNESAVQETDFTELSASGKVDNGVLTSDDLNAASPLFRVGGAGKVDIAGQTIDYVAKPTIVNTASGQGGKQLADLNGVVIPIHVTGTFAQPRYSIDVKAALQQKATEKVQQRLSDQIDKKLGEKNPELSNQLKQGLGALFGRKKKPDDTPSQPATPPSP